MNMSTTTTDTSNNNNMTAEVEEQEIVDEARFTIKTTDIEIPVDFVIHYKSVPLKLIWNSTTDTTLLYPKKTELLCVKRLCTTTTDSNELLILLTTNQKLYTGYLQQQNNAIRLSLHMCNIVDVDCCCGIQQIFEVNHKGEVHMQHLSALLSHSPQARTKLAFDPLELNERGIHIVGVCCAAESALFLSDTGDTYIWGNCGEILVAHNQPTQVRLYDQNKFEILQMAAGDDFFVFLLRPILLQSSLENVDAENLINIGKNMVHTQLHTFGANNNGLLCISDCMPRNNVQHLSKMDDLGVQQISATHEQALALLLDGRVFVWGRTESITPTEIHLGRGIMAAQCTLHDILVHKAEQQQLPLVALDYKQEIRTMSPLLASGSFCLYNKCVPAVLQETELRDALMTTQTLMKQLLMQFKNFMLLQQFVEHKHEQHSLILLCQLFKQMLYLHAAFLSGMIDWCLGRSSQFLLMQHVDTAIQWFKRYTHCYCNLLAWNQFTGLIDAFQQTQPQQQLQLDMSLMQFLPQTLNVCYMRVLQPLQGVFPQCVEVFHKLRTFSNYHRQQVQLAEKSLRFWLPRERYNKLSKLNEYLERRVLLSSFEVPLKLAQPSSSLLGGNHVFILCNDGFFHLNGNTMQRFAFKSLWLLDKSINSFCVITPECLLVLAARESEEKQRWWQELQELLRQELGFNSRQRSLSYKFSQNHTLYAQVLAMGQWRDGLLHGMCHLEYENGKFYAGQMRNGHIEGYGKMLIPGVGLYEGDFKAGKFHGHGIYEMCDGEVYEGYFRKGLFHGHGVLRSNYFTYVGEYQSNVRCGYGVLDDMITCEKYMGMFSHNKRNGAGICVTMTGAYFEGNFVNNDLMGAGVAIFENGYHYEGELTISGPKGKGTYFMANASDSSEELSNGSILSGNLDGNWQDVSIVSGNLAFNKSFGKYAKSFGTHVADNQLKWRALFRDFTEEILGNNDLHTQALWKCILHYIRRQKKREMQDIEWSALVQQNQTKDKPKTVDNFLMRNIVLSLHNNNNNENCHKDELQKCTQKFSSIIYFKNAHIPNAEEQRLTSEIQTLYIKSETKNNSLLEQRARSQETLYDTDLEWDRANSSLSSCNNDSANSLRSSIGSMLNISNMDTANAEKSEGGSSNASSNYSNSSSISESHSYLPPNYGQNSPLTTTDLVLIQQYLQTSFNDSQHPLYALNQRIATLFYTAYGCWRVKPTLYLTKQAMYEWLSISRRVYEIIRCMFPALPLDHCVIEQTREVVSHVTLLSPIILSEAIYSTLLVLYANKYSKKDEIYRHNLLRAEKMTDDELAQILHIESAFIPLIRHKHFAVAIQTLKQLQEKYNPKSMLIVIENCMQQIRETHQFLQTPAGSISLSADSIMPLTLFLVLRAAVPLLGAELALLDDLTCGSSFQFEMSGLSGYCYTTLKACYEHITSDGFNRAV